MFSPFNSWSFGAVGTRRVLSSSCNTLVEHARFKRQRLGEADGTPEGGRSAQVSQSADEPMEPGLLPTTAMDLAALANTILKLRAKYAEGFTIPEGLIPEPHVILQDYPKLSLKTYDAVFEIIWKGLERDARLEAEGFGAAPPQLDSGSDLAPSNITIRMPFDREAATGIRLREFLTRRRCHDGHARSSMAPAAAASEIENMDVDESTQDSNSSQACAADRRNSFDDVQPSEELFRQQVSMEESNPCTNVKSVQHSPAQPGRQPLGALCADPNSQVGLEPNNLSAVAGERQHVMLAPTSAEGEGDVTMRMGSQVEGSMIGSPEPASQAEEPRAPTLVYNRIIPLTEECIPQHVIQELKQRAVSLAGWDGVFLDATLPERFHGALCPNDVSAGATLHAALVNKAMMTCPPTLPSVANLPCPGYFAYYYPHRYQTKHGLDKCLHQAWTEVLDCSSALRLLENQQFHPHIKQSEANIERGWNQLQQSYADGVACLYSKSTTDKVSTEDSISAALSKGKLDDAIIYFPDRDSVGRVLLNRADTFPLLEAGKEGEDHWFCKVAVITAAAKKNPIHLMFYKVILASTVRFKTRGMYDLYGLRWHRLNSSELGGWGVTDVCAEVLTVCLLKGKGKQVAASMSDRVNISILGIEGGNTSAEQVFSHNVQYKDILYPVQTREYTAPELLTGISELYASCNGSSPLPQRATDVFTSCLHSDGIFRTKVLQFDEKKSVSSILKKALRVVSELKAQQRYTTILDRCENTNQEAHVSFYPDVSAAQESNGTTHVPPVIIVDPSNVDGVRLAQDIGYVVTEAGEGDAWINLPLWLSDQIDQTCRCSGYPIVRGFSDRRREAIYEIRVDGSKLWCRYGSDIDVALSALGHHLCSVLILQVAAGGAVNRNPKTELSTITAGGVTGTSDEKLLVWRLGGQLDLTRNLSSDAGSRVEIITTDPREIQYQLSRCIPVGGRVIEPVVSGDSVMDIYGQTGVFNEPISITSIKTGGSRGTETVSLRDVYHAVKITKANGVEVNTFFHLLSKCIAPDVAIPQIPAQNDLAIAHDSDPRVSFEVVWRFWNTYYVRGNPKTTCASSPELKDAFISWCASMGIMAISDTVLVRALGVFGFENKKWRLLDEFRNKGVFSGLKLRTAWPGSSWKGADTLAKELSELAVGKICCMDRCKKKVTARYMHKGVCQPHGSNMCGHPYCRVGCTFGYPGSTKTACAEHHLIGMTNLKA